jgi:hypothetical protein
LSSSHSATRASLSSIWIADAAAILVAWWRGWISLGSPTGGLASRYRRVGVLQVDSLVLLWVLGYTTLANWPDGAWSCV